MANDEALAFLNQKITALTIIQHEVSHLFAINTDLDESDELREQLTEINQDLFVFQTERNQLADASVVVPAPTQQEVDDLTRGLKQLDSFVRTDQNIHMALNFLTQVAALVKSA